MLENSFVYENIYTFEERKQLVAEFLRGIRKANNMTQKQVADFIGINAQTYATYERGRNEPPAEVIIRLSYLYNIPTDIILQKDNLTKDKSAVIKQLDNFDKDIDYIKGKILSSDPETREKLTQIAEALGDMTKCMRQIIEKK